MLIWLKNRSKVRYRTVQLRPAQPLANEYCRGPRSVALFGAAAGAAAARVNITTRYDYTSLSDQGYLLGPGDMETESIAVVRTRDRCRER